LRPDAYPGVTEPAGRHGTVTSGTLAGEWILHYWSRLTAAQQRTVDRLLDVPVAGQATAAQASDWGDPGFHETLDLETEAQHWAMLEGNKLGFRSASRSWQG
jgi:hypothetical protein